MGNEKLQLIFYREGKRERVPSLTTMLGELTVHAEKIR